MYFSQMYRKSSAHVITYICIQVYMKTYTHLPAVIQIYINYYQNSITSLELFSGFNCGSSNSKSSWYSSALLSVLDDSNNTVVKVVSIFPVVL